MNDIITTEYKGITYNITQEAIDDLKAHYNIDSIAEIERGIDLIDKKLSINVIVYNNNASLVVTKKH